MPIRLITGQPGNGKTLLMMQWLTDAASKADRPIYAAGIDGLAPGLAEPLENPRDWKDCPDGSLIFVDEAWKWFGHLHDASRAPTPKHVLDLAEHRHRGMDFVWTTQMPNQLYPFVRGLIAEHTHVIRRFGTSICELFTWGELCEDVKSQGMRTSALRRSWVHPKAMFDKFKSATQHTIKMRIPFRLLWIPASIVLASLAIFFAYQKLKPANMAAELTHQPIPASGLPAAGISSGTSDDKKLPTTADGWVKALTPTLPGVAYTAPVFAQSLEVSTHPRTLCTITGDYRAKDSVCRCFTEQVTPVTGVTDALCRSLALQGYYDPFRAESRQESVSSSPSLSEPASDPKRIAAGTGSDPAQVGPRFDNGWLR